MKGRQTSISLLAHLIVAAGSYTCLSLNYLCCFGVFVSNKTYFSRDTVNVRFLRLVCYASVLHILR